MATGLYPGSGTPMYLASSNPQEPAWTGMRNPTEVIPNASSSIGMPTNAGLNVALTVRFAAAPAGTAFSVMFADNPSFTDEYQLDTVAAVALQEVYTWSTSENILLPGFIRITNSGGENITSVYGQQIVSTAN